jgi:CrcB protein
MVRNIIAVAIGAMGGAVCRYLLGLYFKDLLGAFPLGTLLVNVTGSFAMGFLMTLVLSNGLNFSPTLVLVLATGFLGSYTTFSSYELDTIQLLDQNLDQTALLYWLGSPIAGFMAIRLGMSVAKWVG